MADLAWNSRSPLETALAAGHSGARHTLPGIVITEARGFTVLQVMARRGGWAELAAVAKAHFGIAPPGQPAVVSAGQATLIWSGPDQFLVLSPPGDGEPLLQQAHHTLAGVASLSDQSHGRALLRVSGPKARDMLAKLCSVDLHPAAFPPGAAAAASIDHTGVNLWREDDASDGSPVFAMLVFSSFAGSLAHTLLDAAAEYGVEVLPAAT